MSAGASGEQAQEVSDQQAVACIKLVLDGRDLSKTSLKQMRRLVAEQLQLGRAIPGEAGWDGLEGRKDWFEHLVQPIVDAVAATLPNSQGQPAWLTEVDDDARCFVTLITLSAVLPDTAQNAQPPLRTLENLSREDVRDAVLDALANPEQSENGGRPRAPAQPLKLVVCLEIPWHFHVALKLRYKTGFLPFKNALRARSGLASHWSTSHREWWSPLRYLCFASDTKLAIDEEPLQWTHDGHQIDLFGECNEHYSAAAHKKRREEAVMRPDPSKKRKRETFGKLDMTSLVLAEGLKTPAQIMALVKKKGSEAMRTYVHAQQGRLKEFLQHATDWRDCEEVASFETESDWDLVQRVAKSRCACPGQCKWWEHAKAFFDRNSATIDRQRVAACFLNVLRYGPAKTRRVPLVSGPTNSAKSTVFNPVDELFGELYVFHTPAIASCAFANIALLPKRFLYLDEFSPVEYAATPDKQPALPESTFLKLFQGQCAEIQVSQAHNNGHKDMKWQRGVVITAKTEDLWAPAGKITKEDIRHVQSRAEHFMATRQVEGEMVDAATCKETFCKWLLDDAAAWASRSVPSAPAPAPAPATPGCTGAIVGGLMPLLQELAIPLGLAQALHAEAASLGAAHVAELLSSDWAALKTWPSLRPLQQRRILAKIASLGSSS